MSEKSGTSIRYTNCSLRATSTTHLFQANIHEKVIQEKSGHRSLCGLQAYEWTTIEHEKDLTHILGNLDCNHIPAPQQNDVKCVDDETKSDGKENESPSSKELGAVFSGELHNCVFNFYSNKHWLLNFVIYP